MTFDWIHVRWRHVREMWVSVTVSGVHVICTENRRCQRVSDWQVAG